MKFFTRCIVAVFALFATAANATFHLWQINELFSNDDGTIQFVELRALAGGQQFLGGHTLDSNGVVVSFHDMQGDSGGRSLLIGTQGFAALNIVTPDYIMPNGFILREGGTMVFGEGADVWNYGSLPAQPNSLLRSGGSATNSPRNYSGATGSVPVQQAASPFNVQGLWWSDPDNSQPGWGINLVHQNTALFMSWFTYDTDGSNMWLYMSNTSKVSANSYTGDINRNVGPAFSSATWNTSAVVPTKVGIGQFTFTDADHGTFQYTVNNVTQTKQIKRFNYASPTPTCNQTGGTGNTTNYTDLWWRTAGAESGWGLNIAHQGNILFISWFTYDANGKGMWIYGSNVALTSGSTYTGALSRNTGPAFSSPTWNASLVTPATVGSVTLTFTDASHATFDYTLDGVHQVKTIERFAFAAPTTTCKTP